MRKTAPANRKNVRSHPRSRLRSAPSSELALRLFRRYEKCAESLNRVLFRNLQCACANPPLSRSSPTWRNARSLSLLRNARSARSRFLRIARYARSRSATFINSRLAKRAVPRKVCVNICVKRIMRVVYVRINFDLAPRKPENSLRI